MQFLKHLRMIGIALAVCGLFAIGFVFGVASTQFLNPQALRDWDMLNSGAVVDTSHTPNSLHKDPWVDVEVYENERDEDLHSLYLDIMPVVVGTAIVMGCQLSSKLGSNAKIN